MLYVLDSGGALVTTLSAYEGDISGGAYFSSPLFVADEERIDQALVYFEFVQEEEINGLSCVNVSVPANHKDSVYICEGNYLVFQDYDLAWQMFEIKQITDIHDDGGAIRQAYAENAFYELLDELIEDKSIVSNTAGAGIMKALENSQWELKLAEPTGIASVSFYYISKLKALQMIRDAFGGDLKFEVAFNGGSVTHKYVSLVNSLGSFTGKKFTYDRDMVSIKRVSDSKNIITACYGRGKGVEVGVATDGDTTYGRRLDIGEVVWSKPTNPCDKLRGTLYVEDLDALARWGRNGGEFHRFGLFIDDNETDANVLIQKTWDYLQANKDPKVTYEMSCLDIERLAGYAHEAVRLGDKVIVEDKAFNPPILVQAEVIKLKRDYVSVDNNVVTVGNFRENFWNMNNSIEEKINDVSAKFGVYDRADMINLDGSISTNMLNGVINTLQNQINAGGGAVTINDADGIKIVDNPANPTKAMKITGTGFAIANTKNADGTWNWRTFGTGDGFVADMIVAGQIKGNKSKYDLSNGMFRLGNTDTDYKMLFDGTNLIINGSVNLPNAGISSDSNSTVRIYAGMPESNKANAPFRVLQDGTVYASTGIFGGTFTGKIDIGNIHIADTDPDTNGGASFKINSDGNASTIVKFEKDDAFVDTSFTLGNATTKYLYFNKGAKTVDFQDVPVRFKRTDTDMASQKDVYIPNSASGKLMEFANGQFNFDVDTAMGDFYFNSLSPMSDMDFVFQKIRNGAVVPKTVQVHIDGDLMVTNSITYGAKITMMANTTSGNQGIDFIVN